LEEAENVIVLNHDVRKRVLKIFPELESKLVHIPVGADGRMFKPIPSQQHLLSVEEFIQNLRDRGERGKDTDLAKQTRSALNIRKNAGIQAEVIDIQERYNASYPDADIQRKFKNIDWQNEKIIVFFGKLLYDKGLHCLITAMPNILSAFPNTRLIVIGSGVDREYMEMGVAALDQGDIAFFKKMMLLGTSVRKNCGGFYDYIDQYFKKTDQKLYADRARGNMRQRIIFTGYLTRYGLSKLLPCAQMSIIPSIVKEAFPMVSIESLDCGVIPVASYFSGLAPILDEVCGLLEESGDLVKIGHRPEKMIQDLSDNIPALLSVLSDKKNMTRFSDRFRRLVESKYRWKTIITEIIDLYAAQCV